MKTLEEPRLLHPEQDRVTWLDAWRRTGREPFAHPSFGPLMAAPGEEARALLLREQGMVGLVPLLLRAVPGTTLQDAASPYGYGGPFLESTSWTAQEALGRVAAWVRGAGLCSAFLRLSIDADVSSGTLGPGVEVAALQQNVVVDLRRTEDRIWADYEHKVRKNVQKARRGGCTVQVYDRLLDPGEFADVYLQTMSRRGAATSYRFDAHFFRRLSSVLAGNYRVLIAKDGEGRTVSVEIVLLGDRYLYSFLGGTLAEAFPLAPNDLLKHEAVLHGHRTGRVGFVLGGGYGGEDGIFRYKRSFDRSGVRDFRAARIVGDADAYREQLRKREEAGPLRPHFFPAYRSPMLTS